MKNQLLRLISMASVVIVCAWLVLGCATVTPEERAERQNKLSAMADESVAALTEKNPDLQAVFDDAVGYMVVDMKVTKVPIVGAGGGKGVVVDKITGKKTYVSVKRLDLGGGYGARAFKIIIAFSEKDKLDDAANGKWAFQAGGEVAAGTASAEGSTGDVNKGFESYVLSEGGAAATVTVRAIRLKPYK